MSQSFRRTSLENATGTGNGDSELTKGHNSLGLAVHAENLDPGSDSLTVQMEVLVDGEWCRFKNTVELTASDLTDIDSDSVYTGYTFVHGVAGESVRASITEFTDSAGGDLSVNAYVLGTNNTGGSGREYRQG